LKQRLDTEGARPSISLQTQFFGWKIPEHQHKAVSNLASLQLIVSNRLLLIWCSIWVDGVCILPWFKKEKEAKVYDVTNGM
jgi:hypothetical protein